MSQMEGSNSSYPVSGIKAELEAIIWKLLVGLGGLRALIQQETWKWHTSLLLTTHWLELIIWPHASTKGLGSANMPCTWKVEEQKCFRNNITDFSMGPLQLQLGSGAVLYDHLLFLNIYSALNIFLYLLIHSVFLPIKEKYKMIFKTHCHNYDLT